MPKKPKTLAERESQSAEHHRIQEGSGSEGHPVKDQVAAPVEMSGQLEMLNRGNRQDCEKRRASVMKIRNDLSQSGEHDGGNWSPGLYFKCTASNTKIGRVPQRVNRTVQSVEFVIKVSPSLFPGLASRSIR